MSECDVLEEFEYKGYKVIIHRAGVSVAEDVDEPLAYDVYKNDEDVIDKIIRELELNHRFGDGYVGCSGALFSGDNQHIPEFNEGKRNRKEMIETIKREIDRYEELRKSISSCIKNPKKFLEVIRR